MEGDERRSRSPITNNYDLQRKRRIAENNAELKRRRLPQIAADFERMRIKARINLQATHTQQVASIQKKARLNVQRRQTRQTTRLRSEEDEYDQVATPGASQDSDPEFNVEDGDLNQLEDEDNQLENDLITCPPTDPTEPKDKRKLKITKMLSLWDNEDASRKIKVEYNEHYQPVGVNAPKLANVIATIVKGTTISLSHENWTDVPNKDDIWTKALRLFDLDERLKPYVMQSAHKKWKDFKNRLKTKYFNPGKSIKELMKLRDPRVSTPDWRWLINFWKSEKGQTRSARGAANRAKMGSAHTIGSRSLANVTHDLEQKKGRKVGRAEVYKVAYTRKDGTPQPTHANTLRKIDEKFSLEPDFQDKPIQEGDLLHDLIGKENRGRVIGIGMGPTPSGLSLPGVKATTFTSLQLEREARQRAESEAQALREEMLHLRNENAGCKEEMQHLRNETAELKKEMLQQMANEIAEVKALMATSHGQQNNSNIPEVQENSSASDNRQPTNHVQQRGVPMSQHQQMLHDTSKGLHGRLHAPNGVEIHRGNQNRAKTSKVTRDMTKGAIPYNKAQSKRYMGQSKPSKVAAQTNSQGGEEVFLKATARPYERVAKATIQSKDPSELVGGTKLGSQCYKVVVDTIICENAELFRAQGNMRHIRDAIGHSIAWPSLLVEPVAIWEHGQVIRTGGRVSLARGHD